MLRRVLKGGGHHSHRFTCLINKYSVKGTLLDYYVKHGRMGISLGIRQVPKNLFDLLSGMPRRNEFSLLYFRRRLVYSESATRLFNFYCLSRIVVQCVAMCVKETRWRIKVILKIIRLTSPFGLSAGRFFILALPVFASPNARDCSGGNAAISRTGKRSDGLWHRAN